MKENNYKTFSEFIKKTNVNGVPFKIINKSDKSITKNKGNSSVKKIELSTECACCVCVDSIIKDNSNAQ